MSSRFLGRCPALLSSSSSVAAVFAFCGGDKLSRRWMSSNLSYKNVLLETRGPIRVVRINRPARRNCVNPETARELYSAFREFDEDGEAMVAILTGAEGNFCAGYDLKEFASAGPVKLLPFKANGEAPMGPSWLELRKPVLAAVSGYAVAGGLELALWCDMRVAEEGTKMGVFCRRFGVPLIDGGTVRLPKLIGLSRALDLILTGREVGAEEALQMGLVNRIVPTGQSLDEAIRIANQIASFPQACMRKDRESAYRSSFTSTSEGLQAALEEEYKNGHSVLKEAQAGAQQFVRGVGREGKFI